MEEEDEGDVEFNMDAPIAQFFKRKRKRINKKNVNQARRDGPTEASPDPEPALLLAAAEHVTADGSQEIAVSEFDYSVENHFKCVDTVAKLCQHPETLDPPDQADIKRFSNSITFLREWRDFNYAPRIVRFACQYSSKEKDIVGGATLSQFSAASVPKKESDESDTKSSKDFVMNVGGAVWALDWCPRVDCTTENHIKSEFVAVAAHPPESSHHKIGSPLTGRGAIQIWCLLTVYVKEDVPSEGNKKLKPNSQEKRTVNDPHKLSRPIGRPRNNPIDDTVEKIERQRGRPRKNPIDDTVEKIERPRGRPRKKPTNDTVEKIERPRGRPRKKPTNDNVKKMDTDPQHAQPLAIEYPMGSPRLHSSDQTSGNSSKHVCEEDSVRTQNDCSQMGQANPLSLTVPKGRGNKAKSRKIDQVHNNGSHILRQCEQIESALVPLPHKNVGSCDANTSKDSIPVDVALPRMMLCLAHNGKVAWDVKWRPVNDHCPVSRNIMGYLAVLLGNGALEVHGTGHAKSMRYSQTRVLASTNYKSLLWEVPLPHALKLVYPASQERIDPRFIKLRPVFRCSMLKCGDKQSIPLTLEWSTSAPYDKILAGCHDGVVALWKFSATDSLTDTRPLLSFSADTGPIRTLAWAPNQSDLESANIIVTSGNRGFKFWDIRDPFRPLWDHAVQGVTYGLAWLSDPRCVFGSVDDGTLWLFRLDNTASDIPITGKCVAGTTKHGFHSFDCSPFSIWNVQASPLTGAVAYCGEAGTTLCFQPTARSVKDPSRYRNRRHHFLCGSLLEEEDALIVASPSTTTSLSKTYPGMKRSVAPIERKIKEQVNKGLTNDGQPLAICWRSNLNETKKQGLISKETNKYHQLINDEEKLQGEGTGKEDGDDEIEVFPPKNVAIHRVRWNVNKGSEKWLCYGGAAGLLRCQQIDSSLLQ